MKNVSKTNDKSLCQTALIESAIRTIVAKGSIIDVEEGPKCVSENH